MADVEGKKLTELRVIDLKTELERRGLDKTGNKAALLDRLAKAIIDEGGNPDECLIVPSGGVRASPKKPIDNSILIEDALETEVAKNESDSKVGISDKSAADNNEEPIINMSAQPDELDMDYQDDKQKIKEEQEATVTTTSEESVIDKKPFIPEDESSNVSAVEANGIDNEDSINLTIGEDDLLAEEVESIDRPKDEGVKKRSEERDTVSRNNEDSSGSCANGNDLNSDGNGHSNSHTGSNSSSSNNDNSSSSNSNNKKGDSFKQGSGRATDAAEAAGNNSSSSSSGNNKDGSSSSTSAASSGANATSLKNKQDGEGCKSGDVASKSSKKDEKAAANASSRNLWVSGLSSTTRATDLKQIFSKYGKVIGAKVVTNARTPGARCYGYVTMSSSDDAEKCIEHLHRTELHGRVISVEKAKGDSQQSHNRKRESASSKTDSKKDEKEKSKEQEGGEKESAEKNEDNNEDGGGGKKRKIDESDAKEASADSKATTAEESTPDARDKRENSSETKDEGSLKDCDTRSNKSSSKKSDRERGNSREDKKRSWDRSRTSRSKSRERSRRDNEERERQRQRDKERLQREEKRRRREDLERQRTIEREAARLEREREKLRQERERIEQEKAELLRLEREREVLVERKKLERERIELKRTQMRLEESRRGTSGGPSSSSSSGLKRGSGERSRDAYVEPERKRMNTDGGRRHGYEVGGRSKDSQGPPPPPPPVHHKPSYGKPQRSNEGGYGGARNNHRDDQYGGGAGRDGGMMRRDAPGSRPHQNSQMDHRGGPMKDRYERPSNFGRDREVHRTDDHRNSRDNRYDNSKPNNNPRGDGRYVENNRQTGWHSGPPSKPFNSVNNRNEQTGWNSRSSDTRVGNSRWNSSNMGNNMGHPRSNMYQSGPTQSYGMSQGNNSSSYDRFDPYKGSMQNMRKY